MPRPAPATWATRASWAWKRASTRDFQVYASFEQRDDRDLGRQNVSTLGQRLGP